MHTTCAVFLTFNKLVKGMYCDKAEDYQTVSDNNVTSMTLSLSMYQQ